MLARLIREESGMTMGLVIIMIVLIGVMGAGLLTFVSTDLNTVVEVNQGQRAFEAADAGVQAAKRQVQSDPTPNKYDDGAIVVNDVQWSASVPNSNCSNLGVRGMCLRNIDGDAATLDTANVSVRYRATTSDFLVVSTGGYGAAKRKVEATIQYDAPVSIPRVYFTRGGLVLAGSATANEISLFALGQAVREGSFSFTDANDSYFGRWAETSGDGPFPNANGSFPNDFNKTARGSVMGARGGVGALGTISGFANSDLGKRHIGSNTLPRTVQNYDGSSNIAFPFEIPTAARDKQSVERVRQRALALELIAIQQGNAPGSAATRYYIDSNPGNGADDAGMPNRASGSPLNVASWYSTSNYETVRFYEFETYNSNNIVNFASESSDASCTASAADSPQGVIAVQNGDFIYNANKAFFGGVIVRAYDSSNNLLLPPPINSPAAQDSNFRNGSFRGEGSSCLKGYANASGNVKISGGITPGAVPALNSLSSFNAQARQATWRECYSATANTC